MNEARKLIFPFSLLLASVLLWWFLKKPSTDSEPNQKITPAPPSATLSPVSPPPHDRPEVAQTEKPQTEKPQTETHWLVDEIGRDITEILHFANGTAGDTFQSFTTEKDGKFQFTSGENDGHPSLEISLSHYLWSPGDFTEWVNACMSHLKLQASPQPVSQEVDLVKVLTSPGPDKLIEQSKRISKHLTHEPLTAEWHEQAALLIGVFALREAAGMFHDPRREMCRMTAHLALAKSFRTDFGPSGTLANLLLLTLAGRQQEAIDGLQALSAEHGEWSRALRLRNTGDWRTIKDPAAASLVEQWELARAYNVTIGPGKVVALLGTLNLESSPDWNRIIMQRSFSVEEGHQFVHPSLKAEFEEFASFHRLLSGDAEKEVDLIAGLNAPYSRTLIQVEGKPELQVLNRGMVAAFHQRHLCQSMVLTHLFLNKRWAVPEEAASFEAFLQEQFSELVLYPLVRQRIADNGSDYEAALSKASALCEENPDLVSASNWVHLIERKDIRRRPSVQIPSPNTWFTPDLPPGTTYDFANRYYDLHQLYMAPSAFWDEVIKVAPYHFDVIRTHRYNKFGASPSAEETHACFANIIDFHFVAMREYSDQLKHDPDAYAEAINRASELDPDLLVKAAEFFVEQKRPDLALQFFEAGFEKAEDRVMVANRSRWLVDYYFDNNRQDDALKIATEGAEVYSKTGLETMGHLMERMGNLEKAEEQYNAIDTRYGDVSPLLAFYERHQKSRPDYSKALEQITNERFPGGLEKVTLAAFTDPPINGCELTSDSALTREAGLKSGDVIVAFEGYRVGGAEQYMVIRELADTLPIHLIIWDGNAYREVEASPPGRRFQCEIGDYTP